MISSPEVTARKLAPSSPIDDRKRNVWCVECNKRRRKIIENPSKECLNIRNDDIVRCKTRNLFLSYTRKCSNTMWCLVLTTVWLLAAVATCVCGGVPPPGASASMHHSRRSVSNVLNSVSEQSGSGSGSVSGRQHLQDYVDSGVVLSDTDTWSTSKRDSSSQQASQLMLRSPRSSRQYDVPQIECPPAPDGMERFACPTPDRQGRYRCIDDHVLCDGFIDCPSGEDEDRQACMFYKTTKAHLDVLADALLRWARGR